MVRANTRAPRMGVAGKAQRGMPNPALDRLRAVVLLGGGPRPSPLTTAVDRSILDLPATPGCTVLDLWQRQIAGLAGAIGGGPLDVRLLLDRRALTPQIPEDDDRVRWYVDRDAGEFRGTAGILVDLCDQFEPDDYILVASAAQVLLEPLQTLAAELDERRADVAIVAHADGTPSGMQLVRCGCLHGLPGVGYVDLKEMALPRIALRHNVRVCPREIATGLPIKTVTEYLRALRRLHQIEAGLPLRRDPFEEDWRSAFAIVEDGAVVHPRARLFDTVVLRGASVDSDIIVVRSLLCPGGTVRKARTVVDRMVRKVV